MVVVEGRAVRLVRPLRVVVGAGDSNTYQGQYLFDVCYRCLLFHQPSVSGTVLPLCELRFADIDGDEDPSGASLRANIMSPYSSSGSSNGQYSSLDGSDSSVGSGIYDS